MYHHACTLPPHPLQQKITSTRRTKRKFIVLFFNKLTQLITKSKIVRSENKKTMNSFNKTKYIYNFIHYNTLLYNQSHALSLISDFICFS